MNHAIRATQSVLRLFASVCISAAALAQQPADPGENVVLIQVVYQPRDSSVAENLGNDPKFYIASNMKEWDARGWPCTGWGTLNAANPNLPPAIIKIASVPRDIALSPEFEFKVTRGTWDTSEVAADGSDLPARTIDVTNATEAYAGLVVRVDVEGWADQRGTRWPRGPEKAKASTSSAGIVMTHDMPSASLGNSRKIRVWLPPGYTDVRNEATRYPVLYMHDGQNCFDAATSFAGEWGVDETLTRLIGEGNVPSMIVVGIDSVPADRTNEYSPVDLGSQGKGTGGKGDLYLRFVAEEVMPFVNKVYRTKTGPQFTAMGGSSLGGLITLHAAMSMPGVFGAILVESPSLWVGDGEMLRRVKAQHVWPQRVFLAMGTKEKGDAANDEAWVSQTREAEAAMRAAGLDDSRLRFVIEEGAAHDAKAWARRFGGAVEFLFSGAPSASDGSAPNRP